NQNGISDGCETLADSDGDGIPDCADNCPSVPNADQRDGDANGHGDACDSLLHLGPCPGNIQVASNSTSGTNVTFDLPPALDGYGAVSVTSVPESGAFFVVGVTIVLVTATDSAGGHATCSFQVNVLPPESPTTRPQPDPNQPEEECPALYRVNGGALRF